MDSIMQVHKNMSAADKEALKQLQDETAKRFPDKKVGLADMLKAVTPGMETPEVLKGC